jgi:hypothetical protein
LCDALYRHERRALPGNVSHTSRRDRRAGVIHLGFCHHALPAWRDVNYFLSILTGAPAG